MAGYNGYSKSNNAVDAESEGRFPMTAAKKIVAEKGHVPQAFAAKVLRHFGGKEYHHTSKFYNCTNYYDTSAAIHAIDLARELGYDCLSAEYLGAFFAHGLQCEYEWDIFYESYNFVEYRKEVEIGIWKRMGQ